MSTNAALIFPVSPPAMSLASRYVIGDVREADGDVCLVKVESSLLEARRALSCLIGVLAGDRIALLVEPGGAAHIVSVLERSAPGALRISTARDLSIESGGELSLRSEALSTVARQTRMLVGTLRLVASDIVAESRAVRLVCSVARATADSLHVVAQRSFRHVEHSDHQRCGYLDLEAEQLVQIKARNTMIMSEQMTRVDGSQIHVG
jgi:Protein of unknown function (DUF3540)